MIEMQVENERLDERSLQKLGEDWVQAITEGNLDRLEKFCHPNVTSRLLLPRRIVNLDNASGLVAEYRDWFGSCTNFKLEASRVSQVGERLGIFYRFRLQDQGDWYDIEQQLYCTMKDGRVEKLSLLCSGFQLVGATDQTAPTTGSASDEQTPVPDDVLGLHVAESATGSTCAVLTPMIKSKLRDMRSGQVLEVRVNDPSAQGDVEAWSRLSGNALLKVINEDSELRFFVRKK